MVENSDIRTILNSIIVFTNWNNVLYYFISIYHSTAITFQVHVQYIHILLKVMVLLSASET